MVKVIISGYGKMGHMVEKSLKERNVECVAASEDIQAVDPAIAKECVCIDFTTPAAFRSNYRFLAENFKAVVVGTSGWNDIEAEVKDYFRQCGTTMIYGSNFSIGMNLFFAMTEHISGLMARTGGYSPYMVEMHHCHKLDAPSGTAKTLASIVDKAMGTEMDIQSVRCGEIPGIHTIGFEGLNDRITITHEAFSRAGFADGAVLAAIMTEDIDGVYEFKDIVFDSGRK